MGAPLPYTSKRTVQIWKALFVLTEAARFPPTMREIADHCGISSTSIVSLHLKKLERAQVITRYPRTSRGIVLLRKPD